MKRTGGWIDNPQERERRRQIDADHHSVKWWRPFMDWWVRQRRTKRRLTTFTGPR